MLWAKAVTLRLVTTSSIRTNDETILHSFFILPPPLIAERGRDAPGICYRACRLTLNGGRQNFDGKCVFRIFRICDRAIQQATLCRSIGSDRIRIVIVAADFLPLSVRVYPQIVAVPRRDGGDNAAMCRNGFPRSMPCTLSVSWRGSRTTAPRFAIPEPICWHPCSIPFPLWIITVPCNTTTILAALCEPLLL